jgi:hypothetical protein
MIFHLAYTETKEKLGAILKSFSHLVWTVHLKSYSSLMSSKKQLLQKMPVMTSLCQYSWSFIGKSYKSSFFPFFLLHGNRRAVLAQW